MVNEDNVDLLYITNWGLFSFFVVPLFRWNPESMHSFALYTLCFVYCYHLNEDQITFDGKSH